MDVLPVTFLHFTSVYTASTNDQPKGAPAFYPHPPTLIPPVTMCIQHPPHPHPYPYAPTLHSYSRVLKVLPNPKSQATPPPPPANSLRHPPPPRLPESHSKTFPPKPPPKRRPNPMVHPPDRPLRPRDVPPPRSRGKNPIGAEQQGCSRLEGLGREGRGIHSGS